MSKTCIVYYSWGGHTRTVAASIAKKTGATLLELIPIAPYPTDYNETVNQAKDEIKADFLPPLSKLPDISTYDTIFLGTPNWWSTIAPPLRSFLTQTDTAGKRLAPFVTHGGGGVSRCQTDVAALCPHAEVAEALAIWEGGGTPTAAIESWLAGLEI